MDARRVVAGLLLGAGLLVGCSGEDDAPSTVPSVTEAATASESPVPTPTAVPSTPGVIDAAVAESTARAFFNALNQVAQEGGGYERFDAVVADSCSPCQQQSERLRTLTSNGQRVVGGVVEVVDVKIDQLAGNTALVRMGTRSPEGSVVAQDGSKVEDLPPLALSDVVLTVVIADSGAQVADLVSLGQRP